MAYYCGELITLECGHELCVSELKQEMFYGFDCDVCGLLNQMPIVFTEIEA
jgi:hypothetical protein